MKSSFNQNGNTFKVILDNDIEVSGTYKVAVVRSNSFCALNFLIECNSHKPPPDSHLEQGINFIAAQHEISKKISEYAFQSVKNMFPNATEEQIEDINENNI